MTRRKQRGEDGLEVLLRSLRLPSFVAHHEEVGERAHALRWSRAHAS